MNLPSFCFELLDSASITSLLDDDRREDSYEDRSSVGKIVSLEDLSCESRHWNVKEILFGFKKKVLNVRNKRKFLWNKYNLILIDLSFGTFVALRNILSRFLFFFYVIIRLLIFTQIHKLYINK